MRSFLWMDSLPAGILRRDELYHMQKLREVKVKRCVARLDKAEVESHEAWKSRSETSMICGFFNRVSITATMRDTGDQALFWTFSFCKGCIVEKTRNQEHRLLEQRSFAECFSRKHLRPFKHGKPVVLDGGYQLQIFWTLSQWSQAGQVKSSFQGTA